MRLSGERLTGIGIAITLHLIAIGTLLQIDAVRRSVIDAAPILVNVITPPSQPPPKPEPRRPLPPVKPAATPPPILSTQANVSPAPFVVPLPPKDPLPPETPRAPPAAVAGPAPPPAPPEPLTPPEFDAAYLKNPRPAYPLLSRRYREQGRVLLRVLVSAEGSAEKIDLQTSSGWPRLDEAAQEVVRTWRFVPARQGDKPVPAWVNVPINFKLEG